ncbi:flagellar hook protein FlgE [Thiomicrorhabdus lithotrophica]|uniref:Flagellar hook protein FlgE n=1 Tax=Thiomicrorhabdus lithotrophica TaxID=2949997 RepID=A0ABY8CBN0_9GAMM|nr:flagellar hook protein FlgE [Thiomicrorhabdus lithotrophica]WEJ63349.1 flagellar hook protein FlgE [Thiomicrorhabdus lithotrophica]
MGVSYDLNALSGINAASNGLAVISNNLANAQSAGFKSSRAEFADMFSGAQTSPGNGVRVEAITQDFTQGTLTGTGRELDMAIDGEGLFVLEDPSGKYPALYTRNGSFNLDKDGILVNQSGYPVQGYLRNELAHLADPSLVDPIFETTLSTIDLDDANKDPRATSEMNFDLNVDGQEQDNINLDNVSVGLNSTGLLSLANADNNNMLKLAHPAGTDTGLATGIPSVGDTPADDTPYTGFPDFSTNKIVFDSLGGEHRLTASFYKRTVVAEGVDPAFNAGEKYTSWLAQYTMQDFDEKSNSWIPSGFFDSNPASPALSPSDPEAGDASAKLYELRFDTDGNLAGVFEPASANQPTSADIGQSLSVTGAWVATGTTQPNMNWTVTDPLTGASDPISIDIDFANMTGFSGSYDIRGVSQNGYSVGDLVGLTTSKDGIIEARYSNGRSVEIAQLAIADFNHKDKMQKLGGQTYAESFESGTAQIGRPSENGMGAILAGSLEYSNVDVAGELVNMIQTQRTYQASAQVISTSQTLTQTILNL